LAIAVSVLLCSVITVCSHAAYRSSPSANFVAAL
jgi:hypothetical protein